MLKIDRTVQDELHITEDDAIYTGKQMSNVLKMLEDGNKGAGGLGKARVFFGIAGMCPEFSGYSSLIISSQALYVLLLDGIWL